MSSLMTQLPSGFFTHASQALHGAILSPYKKMLSTLAPASFAPSMHLFARIVLFPFLRGLPSTTRTCCFVMMNLNCIGFNRLSEGRGYSFQKLLRRCNSIMLFLYEFLVIPFPYPLNFRHNILYVDVQRNLSIVQNIQE